jgi:hypothetical protein
MLTPKNEANVLASVQAPAHIRTHEKARSQKHVSQALALRAGARAHSASSGGVNPTSETRGTECQAARELEAAFLLLASSADRQEVTMWSEWLARTLSARRTKEAAPADRAPAFVALPDLEGDGLHPGADEFRAAMNKAEVESETR